jgi:quercetin dioxygenase-like cupin family protein
MQIVRADQRRVTTTPNAVMTTVASPTLGHAAGSLWWVEMNPGAENPEHAFAAEVTWAVTRGLATVWVQGESHDLAAGDTAVLPADVMRRIVAGDEGFTAIVSTPEPCLVSRSDGLPAVVPPWIE